MTSFLLRLAPILSKVPVLSWLIRQSKEVMDHDRGVFSRLDSVLSEESLDRYLEGAFQQILTFRELEPVSEYLRWATFARNDFLVPSVRQHHEAFKSQLSGLREFLGTNLFPRKDPRWPSNRYYFLPDKNPELDGSAPSDFFVYWEEVKELNRRIQSAEVSYRRFRRIIMEVLRV